MMWLLLCTVVVASANRLAASTCSAVMNQHYVITGFSVLRPTV